MPEPTDSAERAERFLENAADFHLGDLVTEASHPRSADLSKVARRSTEDGLGLLFDVDRDVVAAYEGWSRSAQPARIADAVLAALRGGGRVFFTGCGATGRLSIQLDAVWRGFWQDRRARGLAAPPPDLWEDRTRSVMAGADYALIKAVEGFEDFAPFGRKQIADLGLGRGDIVFAITEGGETSFVIGTAWQGLDAGARVFFVYNNPDAVLRRVRRSREVIEDPRIEKINLTTGPMAVTGSTRMQATSIQLAVMLTILEMVLRDLLEAAGALDPGLGPAASVPGGMRSAIRAVQSELSGTRLRRELAPLVESEERIYRSGARASYFAASLAIDVLTDTTERSPTFCIPAFKKYDDAEAADSWAFLFTSAETTSAAWPRLLRRPPQTIEWTEQDLRTLLDEEAAARQAAVLREIGARELLRFRIGLDGLVDRPVRPGDGVTLVLGSADLALVAHGAGPFTRTLTDARAAGAAAAVVAVGPRATVERLARATAGRAAGLRVRLPVPEAPFLLDPMTRLGVKMLLNALSTCTMVRLGRVLENRMIWVVPSNFKLIDRAARYIRDLTGVSYEQACGTLFEVIDYVEPRRQAGQAYPPPVGVATMRIRYGLDLAAAEARVARELS
jgi:N-acetylmuramic acid 6-phosphate etherase